MSAAGPDVSSLAERAAGAFVAYRDGDRPRMAELVEAVSPLLWRVARSYRLEPEVAEDVVQNTWFALIRHADAVADPAAVLQWLIVTARRESWRVARADGRTEPVEADRLDRFDRPAPVAEQPEEATLRSSRDRLLWRHVAALPERCRRLLSVIAFADRPDYAAVAAALGMPVGSIGPTRGRCLARLRESLAADAGWAS